MKLGTRLAAVFFSCFVAATAHAGVIADTPLDVPIVGGDMLVASDGTVTAVYLGSNAGYFNTLYLGDLKIFDKKSAIGSVFDLGEFSKYEELIFHIHVTNTGLDFFTGNGALNPDAIPHAEAITSLVDGVYVTKVGFEDLRGGGDLDYNDFEFQLTNVVDPAGGNAQVPEPSVLFLLSLGMLGLVAQRRQSAGRTITA